MRKYIVELTGPPYPTSGPVIKCYRRLKDWNVDYLSPDMIDYWEVSATSRESAIAEAMMQLHRTKMHLLDMLNKREVTT